MTKSGALSALFGGLAVALFLLALTTLFKARHVTVWQLSILATEYGHWLALLCAVLIAVVVGVGGAARIFSIAVLAVCLVLYARPVVSAAAHQAAWSQALTDRLGLPPASLSLSFSELWRVAGEKSALKRFQIPTSDGQSLDLDFYPASSSASPAPWLVVVHGGGWDSGNNRQFAAFNALVNRSGYAVAAVSYRFAPRFRWPAQKEDVLAAIEYVKTHASGLNVDRARWALVGRSAGGQIAEAVAYQVHDAGLKGLIAFYSPADLEFAYRHAAPKDLINSRDLVANYVGGNPDENSAGYKDASPYFFAEKDSVPTLLLHGAKDPLTWNVQSQRLYDRLSGAGGRVAYIEFPWATHAFDFNIHGPAGQLSAQAVLAFLEVCFSSASPQEFS